MREFVLYSYFRSSASYRVRIAMNLKKLSYDYKAVHLIKNGGEQHDPEYRKLNPIAQVPTLVHNGRPIAQSMAIIEYLDLLFPQPALFPQDPFQRSQVIQACEIVNSGVQPLHNSSVLQKLGTDFKADDAAKNAWTAFFIRKGLDALEVFLKPLAGEFCFGNSVSAADCFMMPNFANAERFQVALSDYPTLLRINTTCSQLDAFKKASPKHQPDTPPEFK
jgi:maleylacetoacetate isomerase